MKRNELKITLIAEKIEKRQFGWFWHIVRMLKVEKRGNVRLEKREKPRRTGAIVLGGEEVKRR